MAGKTLLSSSLHRSRNTVAEVFHIMAKQKPESTTRSCQADIHPDPPATHNFLPPDPNSSMIHILPKQHPLPENKSSKHESVRAISDSIHTTAQLALLPFEHLEHLNLDSVVSDGQSSTCHMPYPCEEVEEVGILLGLFCVSRLLVLMIKSGDSEVVSLVMTSDLYNVCNATCSCWQPCPRGSFLPVCCPGTALSFAFSACSRRVV